MANEWKDFKAYTEPVSYTATGKRDTSYLGRMSFETITEYVEMSRILTIPARGYLFHNADGSLMDGNSYARVEYARNALCAWCSAPDKGKDSDPAVDFGGLSKDFPDLVNGNDEGWYWRHMKNVIRFVRKHAYLYGSYARGDYHTESDIDILLAVDMEPTEISALRNRVGIVSSDLSLKRDETVSVTVKPFDQFRQYADVLPYYKNVLGEGIRYAS